MQRWSWLRGRRVQVMLRVTDCPSLGATVLSGAGETTNGLRRAARQQGAAPARGGCAVRRCGFGGHARSGSPRRSQAILRSCGPFAQSRRLDRRMQSYVWRPLAGAGAEAAGLAKLRSPLGVGSATPLQARRLLAQKKPVQLRQANTGGPGHDYILRLPEKSYK